MKWLNLIIKISNGANVVSKIAKSLEIFSKALKVLNELKPIWENENEAIEKVEEIIKEVANVK